MRALSAAWAVAGLLALAGCMSPRQAPMPLPVADPSLEAGGTCNDAAGRFLLGKTVDERIADYARERAGARLVRVLRPGVPHDEEQRASRLSIEVDAQGMAVAVRCG